MALRVLFGVNIGNFLFVNKMNKDLISSLIFWLGWTCIVFYGGYTGGKNSAQKSELKKDVELYQQREINTLEQEKTAQQIKIVYKEIKSDEKDCDFVLDFNVNKCLPK